MYLQVEMKMHGETYTPQSGDVVRFYLNHDDAVVPWGSNTNPEPLITKVIPNETLVLHLEPNDTKSLSFGRYRYDIEITFAGGDVDTFINNQPFDLLREDG